MNKIYGNDTLACKGDTLDAFGVSFHPNLTDDSDSHKDFFFIFLNVISTMILVPYIVIQAD